MAEDLILTQLSAEELEALYQRIGARLGQHLNPMNMATMIVREGLGSCLDLARMTLGAWATLHPGVADKLDQGAINSLVVSVTAALAGAIRGTEQRRTGN